MHDKRSAALCDKQVYDVWLKWMLNRESFNFFAIKEFKLKTTEPGNHRRISPLFVRDNSIDIP